MDRYNASYIYSYFLGGGIRGMVVVSMGLSRFDNGRMEGRKMCIRAALYIYHLEYRAILMGCLLFL